MGGVCHFQTEDAPTSILEEQAKRGFAFLEERIVERVLTWVYKQPLPDQDEELDRKVQLTLACIAKIKPDFSDTDAAQSINKAFVAEP